MNATGIVLVTAEKQLPCGCKLTQVSSAAPGTVLPFDDHVQALEIAFQLKAAQHKCPLQATEN